MGMKSGWKVSQYFTQPGQQLVIRGSVPPDWTLRRNSVASSMMVRSAAKSVSNTPSKPSRRRAAASFPSTFVPMGRLNISPSPARTLGAVCTTTCFWGSPRAFHTRPVLSFS